MDTNKLITLLPDMAVFTTVVEQQSFSKAGQVLGVAGSSVSRSIARLEKAFAAKLLERTTRRLRLTGTGTEVYSLCQQMLSSAKLAADAAQSRAQEPKGDLTIAAPKALSQCVLAPMVFAFIAQYPQVNVRFRVDDRLLDPIADGVDVVIQLTQQPMLGLVSKKLADVALVLCASPAYLQQSLPITHPHELPMHRCIPLSEDIGDYVWRFSKDDEQVAVQVQGPLAVNHSQIRKDAVKRGMGISLFPDFTVQTELANGELVRLLPGWRLTGKYQGDLVVQYAQSPFVPTQIRAFVDFLATQF